MRVYISALALLALAACGGGRASGEIGSACMAGGRSAANTQVCSCVQQAANQTLRSGDQARAAAFFADPNEAQEVRQSNASGDESFWERYRNFASTAEAMCAA